MKKPVKKMPSVGSKPIALPAEKTVRILRGTHSQDADRQRGVKHPVSKK